MNKNDIELLKGVFTSLLHKISKNLLSGNLVQKTGIVYHPQRIKVSIVRRVKVNHLQRMKVNH